jgi:hypothetical protein
VTPSTDVLSNAVIKPDEIKGEDIKNDDDDTPLYDTKRRERAAATRHCPYLGTIDRYVFSTLVLQHCRIAVPCLTLTSKSCAACRCRT